jgi:hypothetical protein
LAIADCGLFFIRAVLADVTTMASISSPSFAKFETNAGFI